MEREKKIDTASVGMVTLTFDLNRIEGDAILRVQSLDSKPSVEVSVPVVDIIGAIAKMGNAYLAETSKVLQPYFDEKPCGHKRYEDTPWCAEMSCHNYAGKRDKAPGLDSFGGPGSIGTTTGVRRLGLSPEEEAEGE